VCTQGEDSETLARGLANEVGPQASVIAVPRKFFASIVGAEVGNEVIPFLKTSYKKTQLLHQNVVIIDQAAHHFKTLSALQSVCEHLDSTILAFAVIVDRTEQEDILGEYLHNSYYLSLYSWAT